MNKEFSLCVFCDYQIKSVCTYTYQNEEGEFITKQEENSYPADGGKLIDVLSDLLKSANLIDFVVNNNTFTINHFDPHSGEDLHYELTILSILRE